MMRRVQPTKRQWLTMPCSLKNKNVLWVQRQKKKYVSESLKTPFIRLDSVTLETLRHLFKKKIRLKYLIMI